MYCRPCKKNFSEKDKNIKIYKLDKAGDFTKLICGTSFKSTIELEAIDKFKKIIKKQPQ